MCGVHGAACSIISCVLQDDVLQDDDVEPKSSSRQRVKAMNEKSNKKRSALEDLQKLREKQRLKTGVL